MKKRLLSLSAIVVAMGLSMSNQAQAQDIKIAVIGPLTGQYASFGQQLKNGAILAEKDINAAGGILGKKIKVLLKTMLAIPNRQLLRQTKSPVKALSLSPDIFVPDHLFRLLRFMRKKVSFRFLRLQRIQN